MSNRFFEGEAHAKLYQQFRVQPPKALISRIISFLKEKYNGELKLALDVGCGSGQNTFLYSEYFDKVIGSDISPSQIDQANEGRSNYPNVTFEIAPAEELHASENSVQLITAAEAAHWFNLPRFFQEGLRVLSPGGVMAIYGYTFATLYWDRNPEKNQDLAQFYDNVNFGEPLTSLWPDNNKNILFHRYQNIEIPYNDFLREDYKYAQERQMKISDFIGEIKTWSAFQKYCQAHGHEAGSNLARTYRDRLVKIIEDDLTEEERENPDKVIIRTVTPFFLLMARQKTNSHNGVQNGANRHY